MLWAAFITGLIGSLHCTGMCGPLICAMPVNRSSKLTEFGGLISYNTGRIFSYTLLGILFGTGGFFISAVTGKWYTLVAGSLLLAFGLYKLIGKSSDGVSMPAFMRRWAGHLFRMKNPLVMPALGLLNGFIPCGAVYAALAGATATGDPHSGALYMLVFGLATWPALLASYFFSGYFLKLFKGFYRPATAVFLCLLGILLIVRAVNTPVPSVPESAVCE